MTIQNKRKKKRKAEREEQQLEPEQVQELQDLEFKIASNNELMNVFNLILSINT